MNTVAAPLAGQSRPVLNIALWVGQLALAAVFSYTAYMKFNLSAEVLAKFMPGFPFALMRFIAWAEALGAVGILLPALTRVLPRLTAWAAVGFFTIVVLASGFHISRGEYNALPMTLGLAVIAAFVAWGRFWAAPIQPRR